MAEREKEIMKKRLVCLLLVIAMVAGLCACGAKPAPTDPPATEAPATSAPTTEPAEGANIGLIAGIAAAVIVAAVIVVIIIKKKKN